MTDSQKDMLWQLFLLCKEDVKAAIEACLIAEAWDGKTFHSERNYPSMAAIADNSEPMGVIPPKGGLIPKAVKANKPTLGSMTKEEQILELCSILDGLAIKNGRRDLHDKIHAVRVEAMLYDFVNELNARLMTDDIAFILNTMRKYELLFDGIDKNFTQIDIQEMLSHE